MRYNARMRKGHISARAPTRIDFVGGWTDVQPFCEKQAGLVINAAVGVHAHVVVEETETATESNDKFVRAACKRFALTQVRVVLTSDAPLGSGLGGSGAVGVALVAALARYAKVDLSRSEIAELAHDIEVRDLGVIGGKQDQYAAAFGGFLALTFLGDTVSIEPLALAPERVQELEARSVVVYTGQSRVSGNIHANVRDAFLAHNPDTLGALAAIRRVASAYRTTLQDGRLDDLGELLNENWDAQKQLHPSTTNATVDHFFRTAGGAGALGGKALGAGGGGCLYFLAREGEKGRLCDALHEAGGEIVEAPFDLGGCTTEGIEL